MEIFLAVIIFILVCINIHQHVRIKKLRSQTIEAFKTMCEKIFKEGEKDARR